MRISSGSTWERLGWTCTCTQATKPLPSACCDDKPEMLFNLVDSIKGQESLAAAIPGVLELLDIPYTGTGMLGMALDTNKFFIKELLQRNGIPVPVFQLFTSPESFLSANPALSGDLEAECGPRLGRNHPRGRL